MSKRIPIECKICNIIYNEENCDWKYNPVKCKLEEYREELKQVTKLLKSEIRKAVKIEHKKAYDMAFFTLYKIKPEPCTCESCMDFEKMANKKKKARVK